MPGFCTGCGGQMPDNANNCPSCGKSTGAAAAAPASASSGGGLADNVAGMLAYITIIPPILFLLIEPYNKNKFIRFHCFQHLFLIAGFFVAWIGLMILSIVLAFIPVLGHIVAFLLWLGLGLGGFILFILLLVKAYQGQKWKIPYIGDMAEKQANAV